MSRDISLSDETSGGAKLKSYKLLERMRRLSKPSRIADQAFTPFQPHSKCGELHNSLNLISTQNDNSNLSYNLKLNHTIKSLTMGADLASRVTRRPIPRGPRALLRRQRARRPIRPPIKRIRVPKRANTPRSERKFDIAKHGTNAVEDQWGLRRLESDLSSLVIAVDGACQDNGRPDAQAGYGVFFSSSHSANLNASGRVPLTSPQTSQFAELYAVMKALEIIHELIMGGQEISHVVFKMDSEYVEMGMCAYVFKWVANGFKNWEGKPVVNGRAFRYLHEKVELLERDYGVLVSFCRVPRELNVQADRLAKLGSLS